MTDHIRVLVYPEDGGFIGQCLEHDVCARGASVEDVRRRLKVVFELYEEEGINISSIPEAPSEILEAWDAVSEPPFKATLGDSCAEFRSVAA